MMCAAVCPSTTAASAHLCMKSATRSDPDRGDAPATMPAGNEGYLGISVAGIRPLYLVA